MARYYVSPNGTGVSTNHWNTGVNPGNLVATVNNIISSPPSSPTGDEIWALNGQYHLAGNPLIINQNRAPLSIYGGFAGWENTLCDRNANIDSLNNQNFFPNPSILDGGNANTVIIMQQANVCLIDGFIITRGNATAATMGNNGGGLFVGGNGNNRFENIVFIENEARNNGGGMYIEAAFSAMIKNTIFFNNRANNGGGLYVHDGSHTILLNMLFNTNQAYSGNGNAIYVEANNSLKIINNTIADNATGSSSVYCNNANVDVYNSILYPDDLVVTGTPPSTNVSVEYCLLWTPPIGIPLPTNILIATNPQFVNPVSLSAGGDYHLQQTSPCIDRGNTNLIFPLSATDLEGKFRFIDGINPNLPPLPPPSLPTMEIEIDMGAFEFQ